MAITGCSVFGKPGVEIAPYKVIEHNEEVEIRYYEELVLVSTAMNGERGGDNAAFRKLFNYISGDNISGSEIAMTAPVVMDNTEEEGETIAMTAPVLMDQGGGSAAQTMSFVLPEQYTIDTAPRPTDPTVSLNRIADLQVAVIRFNGFLNDGNIRKHRAQLEQWIRDNGYVATGPYKSAGYNPPWTLPNLRRNEVMIPVSKAS